MLVTLLIFSYIRLKCQRGSNLVLILYRYLQDDLDRGGQQLNLVPTEDATGVTVSSAADVASDLDGVLKQLRNGMVHEQNIESPGQLTPRK